MKVCVVGAGYYAQFHLAAWARMPGMKIVGVAELDPAKATLVQKRWPSSEIFDDVVEMVHQCGPDIVDIVTPEATHLPLVDLLAGHVPTIICQKPLAPTLAEALAMVETAQRAGTTLLVHENFRFQPWFQRARRLIDQGAIGTPLQLTFRFRPGDGRGPDAYLERQRYFRTMAKFLIHETAVHYTDTFRYLLGEVRAVTAILKRTNPAIAGEDAGIVVYQFTGGAVAILDANRDLEHAATEPRYTQGSMLLEGDIATLRLDGEARTWLRQRGESNEVLETAFERIIPNGDSVFRCQTALVGGIRNGDTRSWTASAYLRNIEIEQAIYQSAEQGRTIAV